MYKNTVIQQKDLYYSCKGGEGAMAPFTGQIRTSQEKEKKNIPDRTESTYRWQREHVECFEEPA